MFSSQSQFESNRVHIALVAALKEILPSYLGITTQPTKVAGKRKPKGGKKPAPKPTYRTGGPGTKLTPKGRKRLSLALKRRWAAYRAGTGKSPTGLRPRRKQ